MRQFMLEEESRFGTKCCITKVWQKRSTLCAVAALFDVPSSLKRHYLSKCASGALKFVRCIISIMAVQIFLLPMKLLIEQNRKFEL
jgi:hypothetical protein